MQKQMWVAAWLLLAACGVPLLSGCGQSAVAGPRPDAKVALELRESLASGSGEAATGDAAAESTGTGWGNLSGTFKFTGTPPSPKPLDVNKDTEVCGKGAGILDNSLLVGSDGGIANIVIYARAKRVNESAQALKTQNDADALKFDQKGCMFLTHVLACQVNQKIQIFNSDPIGHNTKIDPAKGAAFNQNVPAGGDPLNFTLAQEEATPAVVSCSIHPWMRAYMLPRKDAYFAVTDANGKFEIKDLPAGEEVEVQVWHERGTGPGGGLVLADKDLKWSNKGRFKVKLDADQTKDLQLQVPASAFK